MFASCQDFRKTFTRPRDMQRNWAKVNEKARQPSDKRHPELPGHIEAGSPHPALHSGFHRVATRRLVASSIRFDRTGDLMGVAGQVAMVWRRLGNMQRLLIADIGQFGPIVRQPFVKLFAAFEKGVVLPSVRVGLDVFIPDFDALGMG